LQIVNNSRLVTNTPSANGSENQVCYVPAPRPENESARQAELYRLNILDTPTEERFDRVVRLTRRLFDVPITYVSLVDQDRQWFKSSIGLEVKSGPRDVSFCGHAILQDGALIVPDARKDLRFAGNPNVIGEPFVRFYAGYPLRGPTGHKVGTLCIVDKRPRTFSAHETELLHELTALVEHELQMGDVIKAQNEAIMAKDALAESQAMLAQTVDELQASKQQTEEMLHNILPVEVAQELRANGNVKPMRYEPVFVLFTDFVGFTKVAESMEAADLVEELNECFCHFDWVVGKYGVEKLKTIGDGYLAVAGIPRSTPDDAMHILQAALEMRDYMLKRKAERQGNGQPFWDIRIGLHVGPLIAGVVGVRKLAYDVWGDTVNIASRVESAGAPGRVNVSADFHCWLSEQVISESRGLIECKGKGEIEMFFIDGLKA
jgi:class 3 adenylate cyclase